MCDGDLEQARFDAAAEQYVKECTAAFRQANKLSLNEKSNKVLAAIKLFNEAGFTTSIVEKESGTAVVIATERHIKSMQIYWEKDQHHLRNASYKLHKN